MSTVAEIWSAIQELSLQERCELEALLHPFEDDDWDRQMLNMPPAKRFRSPTSCASRDFPQPRNI
jgi:hypothetical protein